MGGTIDSSKSQRGLLVYQGKTVCDNGFNDKSADAICRKMGYSDATGWASGATFELQYGLEIGLNEVMCENSSWESCRYLTANDCDHNQDVHLKCRAGKGEI